MNRKLSHGILLTLLAIMVILIVVGFVTEKAGWTAAGALVLFLPVFGHFAATMFFLGGLGFLRLARLAILDMNYQTAFRGCFRR